MISEAVILAGGFGTRLQSVVKEIPKPMAPVAGKPFLEYLLNYLLRQHIQKVILSVGYKHEVIKKYFGVSYKELAVEYAVENEPLGTGGGITNALQYCGSETILLLNGDSFFDVDIKKLYRFHAENAADLTLSLKEMFNVDRYGAIEQEGFRIVKFNEKKFIETGLINGGVYLLNKPAVERLDLSRKFSFEQDLLAKYVSKQRFYGLLVDAYFIDIGIPEDYKRAQTELLYLNK